VRGNVRALRHRVAHISGPSDNTTDRASRGTAKTFARGARIFNRTADTRSPTRDRAARRDRAMRCNACGMVRTPTRQTVAHLGRMR
jgi:hypothetical protein